MIRALCSRQRRGQTPRQTAIHRPRSTRGLGRAPVLWPRSLCRPWSGAQSLWWKRQHRHFRGSSINAVARHGRLWPRWPRALRRLDQSPSRSRKDHPRAHPRDGLRAETMRKKRRNKRRLGACRSPEGCAHRVRCGGDRAAHGAIGMRRCAPSSRQRQRVCGLLFAASIEYTLCAGADRNRVGDQSVRSEWRGPRCRMACQAAALLLDSCLVTISLWADKNNGRNTSGNGSNGAGHDPGIVAFA